MNVWLLHTPLHRPLPLAGVRQAAATHRRHSAESELCAYFTWARMSENMKYPVQNHTHSRPGGPATSCAAAIRATR